MSDLLRNTGFIQTKLYVIFTRKQVIILKIPDLLENDLQENKLLS